MHINKVLILQALEQKGKELAYHVQEKEAENDRLRVELASLTLAYEISDQVCLKSSLYEHILVCRQGLSAVHAFAMTVG